jgi:hypothetical protein
MKEIFIRIACCISIILVIAVSGCVAPPKENATSPLGGKVKTTTIGTNGLNSTPTPVYAVEVTPFASVTPISGYSTVPPTPMPGDLYCRIYGINMTGYNKTAIVFNVQNPPMYINYSVKATNYTSREIVTTKVGTKEVEKFVTFSRYDPYQTFEVKVMSKESGEIYLLDGYGIQKYAAYQNRTLKILNRDNMQIEFKTNNLTARAMVWVKPEGNFPDSSQFNLSTDCAYFAPNPRDVIIPNMTKTTAIPTYILNK